ncbi:RDD family protein [Brachybacterium sacelli]|uniref:RDD family membrane protein YckC n=1 Tax=Brachybacterium sacelli TaxID=173364 RepID=A0ABS4X535_9MICO|nr:RDD family protein [Brachybacterium sacelli]MBP2383552.1 putative RDD family membrane protein YckC [Brachybacterium sacelli]
MTTTGTSTATPAGIDREAVITGDAVLLDLRTASFAARMLAAVIDGALQMGILVLGTVGVAFAAARADLDDGLVAAGVLTMSVAAYVGYPVLCELLLGGRSVGRLAMGTRVVRDDGGPVHVRQSLIRAVMAMLEIWSTAGSLALACSVIDRRSRRVGDLLAGTVVIQERMRDPEPERVTVPEALSAWAATADVGRLPLALRQDIRSFLPRAGAIHPASRRQISRDLLHRTLGHVAPAPPPGTDPEEFLAAVVAERSQRDETRLRRAQDRQQELSAEVRAVPFSA